MNTETPFFLQILSLDADADERAIRRAYARQLKLIDQETDPAGFQQLREAYDAALQWAAYHREDLAEQMQQTPAAPVESVSAAPISAEPLSMETVQSEQPPSSPDQRHAVDTSESDAQGAFTLFMQSTRSLVVRGFVRQPGPWVQKLQAVMEDPRLDSLATRNAFERHLVQWLANGWQPGNEALFLAGIAFFNWDEDSRRLNQFGFAGQRINRAIDEYAMFRQQPTAIYLEQKDLIARLANATPPTDMQLLKEVPVLTALAQRYPVWLAVITDLGNLQQWQAAESKIGPWTRRFNGQRVKARPSVKTQKTAGNWQSVGYVAFALVAVKFLFGLGSFSSTPTYQPTPSIASPSSSYQSYSPAPSTAPYPSSPVSLSSALNAPRPSSLPPVFPANANATEQTSAPAPKTERTDRLQPIDADIRRHIEKHLRFPVHLALMKKNPITRYFIDLNDDGSLKAARLIAGSGFPSYDNDVLEAIKSAQPYPESVRRSGLVEISLDQ